MEKLKEVRVGIVGCGNMGSSHAGNIYAGKVPGMKLTALCDIAEMRKEVMTKKYPDVAFFDTSAELIRSGLVDLVVVAVPHYDHPTIAIDAFENGLNVITEKPAGVYTKQVLEMNEAAAKSGKLFGIMYNQRTRPIYQKVKELIDSGELGTIKRVQWTITDWYRPQAYHDSCSWRSTWKDEGGGALINQNPHQLDLWQWLFGMPDKIMSHVSFGKYYDIEVEDDVTAFMQYDNGMTGVYITSTGEAPGTNRLEIACDMGRVVVENEKIYFKRNTVSEREFNKTFDGIFGSPEYWNCEIPVKEQENVQHVDIFRNVAKVLIQGGELIAPGYEGVNGLTISNAIHYSAWTGGWADCNNFPHEEFYNILQDKIKNSKVVKNVVQRTTDTSGTY
ncbi:MAG: Gfo/Idh/MocA family oxidoreductase [Clostridia bacterium]|nr:Gfo/Idh/MocA family oxidoreductase [Clostridia bacterium]